jgi:hypothetical protein
VDGRYEPIAPSEVGRLPSQQSGLQLGMHERQLRWFTAEGELIPYLKRQNANGQSRNASGQSRNAKPESDWKPICDSASADLSVRRELTRISLRIFNAPSEDLEID